MSSVYEIITDRLVTALESGCAPWRKPWADPKLKPGELGSYPANAISKAPYRGVNVFLTTATAAAFGYEHPFWMTFKQAGGAEVSGAKGRESDTNRLLEVAAEAGCNRKGNDTYGSTVPNKGATFRTGHSIACAMIGRDVLGLCARKRNQTPIYVATRL